MKTQTNTIVLHSKPMNVGGPATFSDFHSPKNTTVIKHFK